MLDARDSWTRPHASLAAGNSRDQSAARRFASWFFSNPKEPISPHGVFVWWEARRLPFNLIGGTYGILCFAIFFMAITTSGRLQPGEDAVEPLAVLAAPIVINLLYTLGWMVENIARNLQPRLSPRFGPRLLKLGLGLGLFLSTVPAALESGYRLLQWAGVAS